MTHESKVAAFNHDFEEFFDELVSRVKHKQIEYSRNDNPFHNFERDALLNGKLPEVSLHDYMSKHLVSYFDMINDIKQGKEIPQELIDEKLGDIIVYLGILRTMLWMKKQKPLRN